MKKILTLIGIMTVIFSVYFMLLVVDKSNYIDESRISDFSLSKQINLETLEECAKESNVCVQIRTFNNYSFGNTDCKVEVINPAKNVKYGAVRSLFPNRHMKIIKAQKIENRKVRYLQFRKIIRQEFLNLKRSWKNQALKRWLHVRNLLNLI